MDGSSRSCESFETKLGKSCVFQTCVTNAIILRVQKETSSRAVKYKHGKNKLAPLLKKQVLLLVSEDPEKKRRCHRFLSIRPSPVSCPCRPGRVHNKCNLRLSNWFICCSALRHFVVTRCQPDTAAMARKANYRRHKYMANQPDTEPVNGGRSTLTISCRKLKMEALFY